MENNNEFPISTLKVDFGCTNGCTTDVNNMLKQLKGVKSISIDPKQGKVIVIGNVNPMMIIKLLQKMGKKAQLWSFDKEPKKAKESKKKRSGSHGKHKHHAQCCHDSSDNEDASETDHDHAHKHRTHHYQRSNKMHDQHNNMFGFGNQHHAPPQPFTGYQYAPPPPPPMAGYNHQPFSGYHNYHPTMTRYHNYYPTMTSYQPQHMAYPMPPSMYPRSGPLYGYHGLGQPGWPSYGHYGSRFPNPMIHYSSYADNYRYTI